MHVKVQGACVSGSIEMKCVPRRQEEISIMVSNYCRLTSTFTLCIYGYVWHMQTL